MRTTFDDLLQLIAVYYYSMRLRLSRLIADKGSFTNKTKNFVIVSLSMVRDYE